MGGRQNRIALNHIIQRMHQIVQNQIQPQKIGRFLRNILCINHAFVFADGMGNVHQQRSRTSRRVVNVHAADLPAHLLRHQNIRHNSRHRVRRVVFGIFAAGIAVVVFNQVFKNRGKKSNFCAKIASKLKPASLEISARQKSSRRFRQAAPPAFERAPYTTTPPYACTPSHKDNRSPRP